MNLTTQLRLINLVTKVGIIIVLLIGRQHMPYGFYSFLRIYCTLAFTFLAYYENETKTYVLVFISVIGAILFNPLFPVFMHKQLWSVIDLWVSIIVLLWVVIDIIPIVRNWKFNKSANS